MLSRLSLSQGKKEKLGRSGVEIQVLWTYWNHLVAPMSNDQKFDQGYRTTRNLIIYISKSWKPGFFQAT